MPPKNGMRPIHPGEILAEEMTELGVSADELDQILAVSPGTVAEILGQRRGLNAEFALRLSRYLGSGERLWMNLQVSYDLKIARRDLGAVIDSQVKPLPPNPIRIAAETEPASAASDD